MDVDFENMSIEFRINWSRFVHKEMKFANWKETFDWLKSNYEIDSCYCKPNFNCMILRFKNLESKTLFMLRFL